MIFEKDISNEKLGLLPKAVYNGQIYVIKSQAELDKYLPLLQRETIVGFDTETKPSFTRGQINGIALLQLASQETSLLVKLKEVGIPKLLKDFLENPNIIKVGAAIRDDIKSLQRVARFTPGGFIDLQSVVPEFGIECLSVRKMAAIVLGLKVSKSQQLSNWELPVLTESQQQYASIDAWVCSEIYTKLITSKIK